MVRAGPTPRKVVPAGMLVLLLAAFGGALGLKAWEERQSADAATLAQQGREALALASHVRAELVTLRAQFEARLRTGGGLEDIQRFVPLETVEYRAPPSAETWAEADGASGVRLYVRDRKGDWASGVASVSSIIPAALGASTPALIPLDTAILSTGFTTLGTSRAAIACVPVAGAAVAACVTRPAPFIDLDDLNRIVIYALLLAAPLLAVAGLLQTIGRLKREPPPVLPRPARSAVGPDWAAFEVSGLIGFWRWDPLLRLLTLSEQAARLLGSSRAGEMTLDEFVLLACEDDRRKVASTLTQAVAVSQISLAFACAGDANGVHCEMLGGASEGMYSGTLVNVTDRILAQQRSRRAEALARMALDAHPGPFALWDNRRRLTHWNSAFQRIFNLDKSVVQSGASYDFVMAEVAKFVRVERPLGDDTNAREMMLMSDQWIRLIDRRTANEGLISVGLDISALKRQETSLSRSERRLRTMVVELERTRGQAQELAERAAEQKDLAERASQAKSVFLGNMSHELRTPLNAINGFSEMIAHQVYGPLGDARYQGYAEDILASGQHLLDMINDILDMAKIESGKMQIHTRLIDATDAVDAAIRLIRRRASDKEVSLVFDPDDDLPDINGDHRAIKQMTLNLVANALKFTDAGGEIVVAMTCETDWMVIRVSDTGIGIPAADLPRLGQPFEQAKSPDGRNPNGTGLGLALTKSFAEMHGGRLAIESTVGVGTVVTIYLPVPMAIEPAAKTPARQPSQV
ncbi:MAG: PAS domain-containing sensor histidine kinase [Alphaproteobacteria bacterium]|nr:PAS domain-containing sensor histidine kinase [Alphaproteobacteria bacterium]